MNALALTNDFTAGGLRASDLVARLNPALPLHAAHIADIRQMSERDERYSNERGDVLRGAYQCLLSGATSPAPYEAAWVNAMLAA